MVSDRTQQKVQWNQGSADDEAAAQAVREMLRETLTEERAVQIALLNNRRLQATYEELGIAQASLVQAGLLSNPVFSASALYPRHGGSPDLDLGITQDFLGIFFLPLRRQLAANDFEVAKLRVTSEVIGLASEVRASFYRLQANEQTVELLQQVVIASGAEYDASRRMFEAGNITTLALANSRGLFEDSRIALARAEANRTLEREQLNSLLGLWGSDTQWKIENRLPELPGEEIDFQDVEKRAVAANFELATTRKRLAGTAQRFGLTYTWLNPLEIGIEYSREEAEWSRGPSIEFPIPLFDFGQGRRAAARSMMRQLEQSYTAQAIEVRSTARAIAQVLGTARATAAHVKNVLLPLRTQIVEQTQLQYNAMQVGIFQLLQAKREQIATARQYIDGLRDYWLTRTQLQQLLSGRSVALSRARLNADNPAATDGASEEGH